MLKRHKPFTKETFAIPVKGQRPLVAEQWTGALPGPRVFLSAGLHGNELNGIVLLQRVRAALNLEDLRGTLVFVPVLNITGFRHNSRFFLPARTDLNRDFPGSPTGSAARVLAHVIFTEIIQHCDAGLDLHDAGARNILLPHVRVHRAAPGEFRYERGEELGCRDSGTLTLGRMAGTSIIFERAGQPGMMATAAARLLKKPILTLEVGGGAVLWEEFLKEGVQAVRNVLKYLKLLTGPIVLPRYQFILRERENYLAEQDGYFERAVALGEPVHTGERLGRIVDPINNTATDLVAHECGVVFLLKMTSRVSQGEAVASILQFGHCPSHLTTRPNVAKEDILINDPAPNIDVITEGTLVHRVPLVLEKDV